MSNIGRLASRALFALDPETAHGVSIRALALGLVPTCPRERDTRLVTTIAGLTFENPVGLAAGYDKNGEVPNQVLSLGFGFTEIGTVTPMPQAGNPRPRIFRLSGKGAVINRLGFNNEGHDAVLSRMERRKRVGGIVGVNIGANKDSADRIADYEAGIEKFAAVADYFTVNISSPNTPGLRELQGGDALGKLLKRVLAVRDRMQDRLGMRRPVFVKIAPDLDLKQMRAIANEVAGHRLDGLVVGNTTLSRDEVAGEPAADETGGLSGRPLFRRSTIVLACMRKLVGPSLPLVGVGGIDTTECAWEKIAAGANLVQLYTGMIYGGPCLAAAINRGLIKRIASAGLGNIGDLTSTATDKWVADSNIWNSQRLS